MSGFDVLQASDSGSFKTIVAFECRGVEPVAFDPRVSFAVLLVASFDHNDSIDHTDTRVHFRAARDAFAHPPPIDLPALTIIGFPYGVAPHGFVFAPL